MNTIGGGMSTYARCACVCNTDSTYNAGRSDGAAITGCGRRCSSGNSANNAANYNAAYSAGH